MTTLTHPVAQAPSGAARKKAVVLYDGACPLCRKSVRLLHSLDWFNVLAFADVRDPEQVPRLPRPVEPKRLLDQREPIYHRAPPQATDNGQTDMGRRYVQELTDGETLDEVYLVTEKQLRANRNGNLYIQVELRDRTGAISARLWNAGEHLFRSFEEGDFLRVRGKVQLFQGALTIILTHLDKAETDKVDLTDFLPHTEHDVSKPYERLR